MELIEVVLTPLQRRNRAAFVSFDDLGRQQMTDDRPQRVLEIRERVVLRDDSGEYFGGTVADTVQVMPGVDSYLIRVGVRLPEEWAMVRLGKAEAPAEAELPDAEVLDLMAMLRAAGNGDLPRSAPKPRRRAR